MMLTIYLMLQFLIYSTTMYYRVHLLGGATAGIASWTVAFPIDTVKSIIQADHLNIKALDRVKMVAVARRVYLEGGIKAFFRGYLTCIVRSIPVNAITLSGFEVTKSYILKQYTPSNS